MTKKPITRRRAPAAAPLEHFGKGVAARSAKPPKDETQHEILHVTMRLHMTYENKEARAHMVNKLRSGVVSLRGGGQPLGMFDMRLGDVIENDAVQAIEHALKETNGRDLRAFFEAWQQGDLKAMREFGYKPKPIGAK